MADFEHVKAALKKELLKALPLMDVETIKAEFLDWLEELHFPANPHATGWIDCLKVNPPTAEEHKLSEGRRIRFSLNLHTSQYHYLIAIIESYAPDSRETYMVSVHVRMKQEEWQMQRLVESQYGGEFADIPKARHTIWAQTFRKGGLGEALNACAKAILGHELHPPGEAHQDGTPVPHSIPKIISFPNVEE